MNIWKLKNNGYEALSFIVLLIFIYMSRNELSHVVNLPDPLTPEMVPFSLAGLGGLFINRLFIYRRDRNQAPADDVTALREMITLTIESLDRLRTTVDSINMLYSKTERDLVYGFDEPTQQEVIT